MVHVCRDVWIGGGVESASAHHCMYAAMYAACMINNLATE